MLNLRIWAALRRLRVYIFGRARSVLRPRAPRCKRCVNMAYDLNRWHAQTERPGPRLRSYRQRSRDGLAIDVIHEGRRRCDLDRIGSVKRDPSETVDRAGEHERQFQTRPDQRSSLYDDE